MLSGRGQMRGGCVERAEKAVVVSEVEVQGRIEAGDVKAGVVPLDALLGHGIGSVQGADVPGQGLGGVFVEVCRVVREGTAVQRVAGSSFGDGLADGFHGRVGAGGSSGHGGVPRRPAQTE